MDHDRSTYRLTIAYDGTNYSGWQVQPNATSIQFLIQHALRVILREEVSLIGSGRTDAGVHAVGQVAHFRSLSRPDLSRLQHSLNGLLPADIRVLEIEESTPQFHAQKSAKGKIYHYHLSLDKVQNPFFRLYRWHLKEQIQLDRLAEAANCFRGTHDFTSFANEAHRGPASKNAVRTICRLDIIPEEGGIRLEFEANGFLYKMVRNIVGTMVDVARGQRTIQEIHEMLEKKDRRTAGQAAPPQGLFLFKVLY